MTPDLPTVERLELPALGLTHEALLQSFDQLRRRLAVRIAGCEGAAVGFVDLELGELPTETAGQIVVRATALETTDNWQRVRYEASLRPSPAIVIDGLAVERPFAHAVGQTVALATPAPLVVPSPRATSSTARVA
jgi:hypothetical protein